jgi:group I intron endonuclease
MIGIYKVTSPSGKVYIGQSWDINNRKAKYKAGLCKGQRKLNNSFLKYGFNKHRFEVVHELPEDVTQEIIDTYEILYWDLYRSCGIEMMNIKEPGRGGKLSQGTKEKLSKAKKGKPSWSKGTKGLFSHSAESRAKMSIVRKGKQPCLGYRHTDEAKKNMSEAHKGIQRSAEWRENLSKGLLGKSKSEGHRKNLIGKTGPKKGHKHPPETIEKMRLAATGRKFINGKWVRPNN